MLFSNMIVDVTFCCRLLVISYSPVKVSAGFADEIGLAIAAFELVCCSHSALWVVFVLKIS